MEAFSHGSSPWTNQKYLFFGRASAVVVFLYSLAVTITFWTTDHGQFRALIGDTIKFNTAFGLAFAAISLWTICLAGWTPRAALCASVPFLLGALTLAEYLFDVDLRIDTLVVRDLAHPHGLLHPGRMAPNAAVILLVLGAALFANNARSRLRNMAQYLALTGAAIAILALLGYIFGIREYYRVASFIRISPFTSICAFLLSAGILAARPESKLIRTLLARTPSGVFARRMLMSGLLVPSILGILGILAEQSEWARDVDIPAFVAFATVLMFVSLVVQGLRAMATSEEALNKTKERLSLATHAGEIGIWEWDMVTNQVETSEIERNIFGLATPRVEYGDLYSQVLPQDVMSMRENLAAALKGNLDLITEFRFLRDGEIKWIYCRGRAIYDRDGIPVRMYGVHVDVTERKRHEEILRTAVQRANEANEAKSRFLANMSHEIRTPVTAIVGFLDLLKDPQTSPAERTGFAGIIERNSQQLLRLIDDILDLSKVEAGKLTIEELVFSFPDFIADFASIMSLKASEKGVAFVVKVPGRIPDRVSTDPTRLRQIWGNLVSNSIKFTNEGSVEVEVRYEEEHLVISVTDTGPGIRHEHLERVFVPFGQGDASLTRKHGGTGLGLVLARQLARALGGEIKLEWTEPGRGSRFSAWVKPRPVEGARMVAVSAGKIPHVPARPNSGMLRFPGRKVLVIEDSPDNRALVHSYLKDTGAAVTFAENGLLGVQSALREVPDVVLMDIQMPVMDGFEAARTLRSSGFSGPIIAITAHVFGGERDRCLRSGCSDYLPKPLRREKLLTAIAQSLTVH